ncbi:MAG: secretin N-terminal domain-containing protein [Pseudomonadota bacterium]
MLLLSVPLTIAADDLILEIIKLNSSTAEQTLPLLKPFIAPGGTLTGAGSQLIIKTTPDNLAEIKQLLSELDVPPQQLRIFVTQDIDTVRHRASDNLYGRVDAGNASAELGAPGYRRDGARVEYRDQNGNVVGYRGARTRTRREDNNQHFVTTLEGRPAFIFTGEATPYVSQSIFGGPFGTYSQSNVDLVPTDRGFYVTPRVNGRQVHLDIATRLDEAPRRGDGVIQSRGVDTVISGTLGEWIPLGGSSRSGSTRQGQILGQTRRTNDSSYDVWVKVELLP